MYITKKNNTEKQTKVIDKGKAISFLGRGMEDLGGKLSEGKGGKN